MTHRERARASCVIPLVLCLVLASFAAGCAGDSSDAAGGSGSRLSWDQAEASRDRLSRYSFVLYVDNNRTALSGVRCGQQATAAGYPCSATLPTLTAGSHTLELQATVDGRDGPRSAPVTVTIDAGRSVAGAASVATQAAVAVATVTPVAVPSCAEPPGDECFDAQVLLTTAAAIASPAAVPDGRILFIEDGRTVRVSRGSSQMAAPALQVQPPTRLAGLVADPAFEETRFVWLLSIDESVPDRRTVTVSRFRELGDRLAEEAQVISALPIPPSGEPLLAQDTQRHIYLSIPPAQDAAREAGGPYAGRILRFTADGATPWELGQASPVVAESLGLVRSLAWDGLSRRLWFTGQDSAGVPEVGSLATDATGRAGLLPMAAAAGETARGAGEFIALSVLRGDTGSVQRLMLADAGGGLWLAHAGDAGLLSVVARLPYAGRPVALASGQGATALVVQSGSPSSGRNSEYQLVRLTPVSR